MRDWYTLVEQVARDLRVSDPHHPVGIVNDELTNVDRFDTNAPSLGFFGSRVWGLSAEEWDRRLAEYGRLSAGRPLLVADAYASASDRDGPGGGADDALAESWLRIVRDDRGARPTPGGFLRRHEGPEAATAPEFAEAAARLQTLWADPAEPSPPSIRLRSEPVPPDRVRLVASVATYGGIPADVTLLYRVNSGAWLSMPMEPEGGGRFVAELGPFGGLATIFYRVHAIDAAGRSRESGEAIARGGGSTAAATLTGGFFGIVAEANAVVERAWPAFRSLPGGVVSAVLRMVGAEEPGDVPPGDIG
ncbi:MAG: hypothetical protein ACT4PT_04480 [Methanobacteriota archaeon]